MTKNRILIALEEREIPRSKKPAHIVTTIEQYNGMLDAGYYIKEGQWFVDEHNSVGLAAPEEIAIADLFHHNTYGTGRPTLKKFNRLGFLDK